MAKQTFSSGQILTAAQVNSLQANDYNWTVTAKTASYILTATDAGTRITMSNAAATTITINTATMTAGDVVYLLNIGAGVCTVTAGAGVTINSPGNLGLVQYAGGYLFAQSSTSFYFLADGIQQTKLLTSQVLTGNQASFDTNTLLGGNIPTGFNHLKITALIRTDRAAVSDTMRMRFNNDSTAIYDDEIISGSSSTAGASGATGATGFATANVAGNNAPAGSFSPVSIDIPNYLGTTARKTFTAQLFMSQADTATNQYNFAYGGVFRSTAALTRISLAPVTGANFVAGSAFYLYGIL